MHRPHYDPQNNTLLFIDGEPESKDYFTSGINVFVCGALQNPEKMAGLIGRNAPFAAAVVTGYRGCHMEEHFDKMMPFMVPAEPHAVLTGVVWLDLTPADVTAIETLELEHDLRRRIGVETLSGLRREQAYTYIRK